MNGHLETRMRPTIPAWGRALLGLVALAGLVALVLFRPRLPAMPWQPLQPTGEELLRDSAAFAVWLVLLLLCTRVAWLALRPPRRPETISRERPCWLPATRRPPALIRRPNTRELVELFSRPRAPNNGVPAAAATDLSALPRRAAQATTSTNARATIRLLGNLRAGEHASGVGERATRALIAYLAIKRAPATLDELSEALWPGESTVKTRQRLWKAKRQAQRLLGGALLREHDSYTLDRTRIRSDVDELEPLRTKTAWEASDAERALAFTSEEPLADIDYPWADGERRRLQAIQIELLERIARTRLEQHEGSGALAAAERLIELDPLNESGWRLAMEAEGVLGNRQAILDRYERLTRTLDERLGLRPSGELKAAYRQVLAQQ